MINRLYTGKLLDAGGLYVQRSSIKRSQHKFSFDPELLSPPKTPTQIKHTLDYTLPGFSAISTWDSSRVKNVHFKIRPAERAQNSFRYYPPGSHCLHSQHWPAKTSTTLKARVKNLFKFNQWKIHVYPGNSLVLIHAFDMSTFTGPCSSILISFKSLQIMAKSKVQIFNQVFLLNQLQLTSTTHVCAHRWDHLHTFQTENLQGDDLWNCFFPHFKNNGNLLLRDQQSRIT